MIITLFTIKPILFLLAIPLSLIGYLIKHGTKIHNKLIPVIITTLSMITCFFIGLISGKSLDESIIKYGFMNGYLVATTATHGWDSTYGIKTVFLLKTAQAYKLITLDKEENMDKLKKWHKELFSNVLTVAISTFMTFLICFMSKINISASIDIAILAIVFTSSTILVLDLLKKIVMKDETLNTQYGICFAFGMFAVGAFFIAYIAPTWTVTIVTGVLFVLFTFLHLFTVRYSYIPSLRPQAVVLQDLMRKRWLEYKNKSDADVQAAMESEVNYYFKKDQWGAELKLDSPIFLDSKGTPVSLKDATNIDSLFSEDLITKTKEYFANIIKTREVK